MAPSTTPSASRRNLPLIALLLIQLGIIGLAKQLGPLAISDDDYARVVIAQTFAQEPRLDPTGTSWLPFPFYVTGSVMALFGPTLEVARITQVALALVSAALLYFGARRLGLGAWTAALSAALAAALPSAARVSHATVPEYPAAACMAFAMLCLVRPPTVGNDGRGAGALPSGALPSDASLRNAEPRQSVSAALRAHVWPLAGALALYLACASRYDAWPVAGVYAGFTFCRAFQAGTEDRLGLFLAAALAAAFPLLWLLHGVVWHDDPFFFVARVTGYKAALGAAPTSPWAPWLGYPLAAVSQEPGATFALIGALLLAPAASPTRAALRALGPLLVCLAALLVVLVLGDVRGGAPTHHPERALLSLWLVAPAISVWLVGKQLRALEDAGPAVSSAERVRTVLRVAVLVGLAVWLTFAARTTPGAFADRAEEERLGRQLRETAGAVVVHTPDYGYFAVQAASSRPDRFLIVDKNDPRDARTPGSPEDRARLLLAETRAPWALLPLGTVVPGYRMVAHGERLELLGLGDGNVGYATLSPELPTKSD